MENSRPERQIERAHIRFTKATHLRRCFFIFIVHNCFFCTKKRVATRYWFFCLLLLFCFLFCFCSLFLLLLLLVFDFVFLFFIFCFLFFVFCFCFLFLFFVFCFFQKIFWVFFYLQFFSKLK